MTDCMFRDALPSSKVLYKITQIQHEIQVTNDEDYFSIHVRNQAQDGLLDDTVLIPRWYEVHLSHFLWRYHILIGIESNAPESLDVYNRAMVKRYISYMDGILASLLNGCRRGKGCDVHYRSEIFDLYLVVELSIGRHDHASGDEWRRLNPTTILETLDVRMLSECVDVLIANGNNGT